MLTHIVSLMNILLRGAQLHMHTYRFSDMQTSIP